MYMYAQYNVTYQKMSKKQQFPFLFYFLGEGIYEQQG